MDKKTIIIIASVIFVVVFFLFGMVFWPFFCYITSIQVFVGPLVLAGVSFVLFLHANAQPRSSKMFNWRFYILPICICNVLELAYCGTRYEKRTFRGPAIKTHNAFTGRDGIANPFGFDILPSKYRFRYFINDDFVVCNTPDGLGLWSIELGELVVPGGQTLARNGQSFSQGDYEGVKTADDIIVIPAKYESVSLERNCIIVKKDGKYGVLNEMGNQEINCRYSGWNTETDRNDHEYVIFEDGYNYHGGDYKYYIYDTDRFGRYKFRTKREVYKVETKNVFILRDSHYKYGMYNCSSGKSLSCSYDDYYGYDSSRNAYGFKKNRRYSNEDTYIYYFNEDCEQVDERIW